MPIPLRLSGALALFCAAALAGCERDAAAPAASAAETAQSAVASAAPAAPAAQAVTVYKSPTCGCCTAWARYLEDHGYAVTLVDTNDLDAVKDRLGVPAPLRSCHTATLGDYVIEGHVPVADIRKLLATHPRGLLAVPGMPLGSPGMEHPSGVEAYASVLVRADGTASLFEHHPAP